MALVLTATCAVAGDVDGLLTGSQALLANVVRMFPDNGAIGLAPFTFTR